MYPSFSLLLSRILPALFRFLANARDASAFWIVLGKRLRLRTSGNKGGVATDQESGGDVASVMRESAARRIETKTLKTLGIGGLYSADL